MITINEKGAIYLTRGDSAYLKISLNRNGKFFQPQEGDKLEFSVKKDTTDEDYVVHKEFAANQAFVINPEDTKELQFGKYVYDVQLTTANGEIYTVVEPSLFYIKEEVTNE